MTTKVNFTKRVAIDGNEVRVSGYGDGDRSFTVERIDGGKIAHPNKTGRGFKTVYLNDNADDNYGWDGHPAWNITNITDEQEINVPDITDKNTVCLAILDATAEMYKHPETIIEGHLAKDANGKSVSTMDPTATCFCALGRVARNLGIDTTDTSKVVGIVKKALPHADASAIYQANDDGFAQGDKLAGARKMEALLYDAATC